MKTGGNNNVFINYYIYDVARLLPTDETVIRQSGDMNIENQNNRGRVNSVV